MKPGDRFGCLTAIEDVGLDHRGKLRWLMRCDCGAEFRMLPYKVKRRPDRECRHRGNYRHPAYKCWTTMNDRCRNPTNKKYYARGIRVCKEWQEDFWKFAEHIGPRPSPQHSIDRIDTHGNYEPGNVRWATPAEQNRNMRTNTYVQYQGQRRLLADLPRAEGLSLELLRSRLKLGWKLEKALRLKVRRYKRAQS